MCSAHIRADPSPLGHEHLVHTLAYGGRCTSGLGDAAASSLARRAPAVAPTWLLLLGGGGLPLDTAAPCACRGRLRPRRCSPEAAAKLAGTAGRPTLLPGLISAALALRKLVLAVRGPVSAGPRPGRRGRRRASAVRRVRGDRRSENPTARAAAARRGLLAPFGSASAGPLPVLRRANVEATLNLYAQKWSARRCAIAVDRAQAVQRRRGRRAARRRGLSRRGRRRKRRWRGR